MKCNYGMVNCQLSKTAETEPPYTKWYMRLYILMRPNYICDCVSMLVDLRHQLFRKA